MASQGDQPTSHAILNQRSACALHSRMGTHQRPNYLPIAEYHSMVHGAIRPVVCNAVTSDLVRLKDFKSAVRRTASSSNIGVHYGIVFPAHFPCGQHGWPNFEWLKTNTSMPDS